MSIKTIAIILCAGKGTRMNDDSTNKVCFEVAGIPVIRRIIANYRAAGINNFIVVVGHHAEKVMQCLSDEEGIVYAFQKEQNGTGGAALCGIRAAKTLGYDGPVIISVGDKIIAPEKLRELVDLKSDTNAHAIWGAQRRELNESGGRIVTKDGKLYGVVEQTDSALLALGMEKTRENGRYLRILMDFGLTEKKAAKVLKKAISMDSIPSTIELNGEQFDSKEIEKSNYTNASLYCFDIDEAIKAINSISKENAQDEIYLTDALEYFARENSVELLTIEDRDQMVTYSTKEELNKLNRFFLLKDLKPASYWLSHKTETDRHLIDCYGLHSEAKSSEIRLLLDEFKHRFGDQGIIVTRSPGRVNLMGRHIDHRGGSSNVMCIEDETIMVVSPREDDLVVASNVDKRFEDCSFSISELMSCSKGCETWIDFIESDSITHLINGSKGNWLNYVMAAVLRIQFEFKDHPLIGMNILSNGTIPIAAGLSSSSAFVVSAFEAVLALNHLEMDNANFISLCGEGEWLVGTRGGSGDHAAMKEGVRGRITQMNFKPFSVGKSVVFSPDYRIIVANSFISAKKSEGSKDIFNQKVACYEFGMMLLRKLFPQYEDRLEYLRDIVRIGLSDIEIYEMLLALPEKASTDTLLELLPEREAVIRHIQKSHRIPEYYEIRSVMLYGISECRRAEKAADVIEGGDYERLGRMMQISHNGDRLFKDGKPYDHCVSDSFLKKLISNLKKGISVEDSRLVNQSGGYACSVREVDEIIDMVDRCPGVLGSQISGAGLGGSVVILVKTEFADSVIQTLNERYYRPKSFNLGAKIYSPSTGSGVLVS